MNFAQVVIVASHVPILLTGLLAAVTYRKLDRRFRAFCHFVFFSWAIQMLSLLLWFGQRNNMPLLHLYVPVGFALLCLFFRALLQGYLNTRIIIAVLLLFFVFSVINSLWFQGFNTFNSYALSAQSILVMILSIFTFLVHLREAVNDRPDPGLRNLNWIVAGLFLYYTSTLCLFYFGDLVMRLLSVNGSAYIWIFHSFFSVVMYCCFLFGLWRQTRKSR